MIGKIKLAGKYLDQPLLIEKYKKVVTPLFVTGATLYGVNEVRKAPSDEKNKTAITMATVLSSTVASALYAPKLTAKILKQPYKKYCKSEIVSKNTQLVDNFVRSTDGLKESIKGTLEKAKDKVLSLKEIGFLDKNLGKTNSGRELMDGLIPEPKSVTAKDIKNEIGRLSLYGFIPVAGGVAGGVASDVITEKKVSKEKMANRVKEGSYQYLANIFLCNVGAGISLAGLEKMNIKSKAARVVGMVGGIVATGIVGGNAIANYIGDKVINPLFDGKKPKEQHTVERKPEVLDVCLHTDDIATVAVMSGLKWIEPALPILYGVSGFRAGIGYRNCDKQPQS